MIWNMYIIFYCMEFVFIIRIYIENYSAGIVDEYTPPHDVIQVFKCDS